MSTQQRLLWVDVAKGIAIALMVFGHVWRGLFEAHILTDVALYTGIDRFIYLFHMPLFFFLSGMFVSTSGTPSTFGPLLWKRAVAYLYPLLIWSWILALSRVAAGDSTNRAALSLLDAALYPFPPKDIFWFLWALFLMQTLAAAAVLLPRRWHLPISIAAALGSLVYAASGLELPLVHDTIMNLPYFLAGIAFTALGGRAIGSGRQALIGLALFAATEATVLLVPQPIVGAPLILLATVAVVGSVLLIAWMTERLRGVQLIEAVAVMGTATMAIYVAHVIVLAAVRIVLVKLGIHDVIAHAALGTVVAIAVPLLLLLLASRLGVSKLAGLGPSPAGWSRPSALQPAPARS